MCEIHSEATYPAFRLQRGLDVSNKLRQLLPDCLHPAREVRGKQGHLVDRVVSQKERLAS